MMIKANKKSGNLLITIVGVFVMVTLITIMSACDNQKQEKETEELTESSLTLNNGIKWAANPETTAGINNMIKILSDFQEGENAADYQSLQKNLDEEFNLILKNCTMEGEAHNQLPQLFTAIKSTYQQTIIS